MKIHICKDKKINKPAYCYIYIYINLIKIINLIEEINIKRGLTFHYKLKSIFFLIFYLFLLGFASLIGSPCLRVYSLVQIKLFCRWSLLILCSGLVSHNFKLIAYMIGLLSFQGFTL